MKQYLSWIFKKNRLEEEQVLKRTHARTQHVSCEGVAEHYAAGHEWSSEDDPQEVQS